MYLFPAFSVATSLLAYVLACRSEQQNSSICGGGYIYSANSVSGDTLEQQAL